MLKQVDYVFCLVGGKSHWAVWCLWILIDVSVYNMTCFGWKFNLEMFYMLKIYENVLNVVYFSFTIQYSSI